MADGTVDEAMGAVFGYSILNDASVRHVEQAVGGPSSPRGKSRDTPSPFGPWIVPSNEILDPMNLRLRTWVNGELRQGGTTEQLAWSIAEMVAGASEAMTLGPSPMEWFHRPHVAWDLCASEPGLPVDDIASYRVTRDALHTWIGEKGGSRCGTR